MPRLVASFAQKISSVMRDHDVTWRTASQQPNAAITTIPPEHDAGAVRLLERDQRRTTLEYSPGRYWSAAPSSKPLRVEEVGQDGDRAIRVSRDRPAPFSASCAMGLGKAQAADRLGGDNPVGPLVLR